MRQTRQTLPGRPVWQIGAKPSATAAGPDATRRTRLSAALPLALALSALAFGMAAASAGDAKGGNACSERYHDSLGRIAAGEYQAVKTGKRDPNAAGGADPSLPGNLLFPPVSLGERTREETTALRLAASLARGKGRTGGVSDADAAWMGDRLRTALGDYLTQSPSPYLCSGVENYVAELRGDARRLGPPPIQREALIAAQKSVAARAIESALAAMKPVPKPADKPADRPSAGAVEDLRPTAGLDRLDTSIATGSTAPAPAGDPDLPPLKPQTAPALDTVADLVSAIDRLTEAARQGNFLAATPMAAPIGEPIAVPATTFPVLSRLAEVRPIVTGVRPLVSDRAVRLRLAGALSSIETLDYLMRARTVVEDPLAVAIDKTFEAILAAHKTDCTCRD